MEAIQDIFQGAVIEQSGGSTKGLTITLAGKTQTVFLDNLWAQCRESAATRVVDVQRFLRAMDIGGKIDDDLPSLERIVPTIKDRVYLDFSQQQTGKPSSLVHEHLAGDIWIVYAVDYADAICSLQQSHNLTLKGWASSGTN